MNSGFWISARVYPQIDVEGGSHMAVSGQCVSADDEVFNPLVAKSFQNLDEMLIHPVRFQ